MPVFEYTARDPQGNRFSGVCNDIAGVAMLREDLARMGDTLLKAKRRKAHSAGNCHFRLQVCGNEFGGFVNCPVPRNSGAADPESGVQECYRGPQAEYRDRHDTQERL